MDKKINCKHGLDRKQEVRARRIKDKLKAGDNDTFSTFKSIYFKYCVEGKTSFEEYLKGQDIVLYSAYMRATTTIPEKIAVDIKIRRF